MHPDISHLVSKLFCEGRIRNGVRKDDATKGVAEAVRKWNATRFKTAKNALFVNIKNSSAKRQIKSVVNEFHVRAGVALCKELFLAKLVSPDDLVVLTPYDGQYRVSLSSLARVVIFGIQASASTGLKRGLWTGFRGVKRRLSSST
jgi:superfamily I DNA and/or RNA helicase